MNDVRRFRIDVLSIPFVRPLVRSPWLPLALQVAALGIVVLLAFNGWGVGDDAPADRLLVLRKTNLTSLAIWGLWWPAMIAAALLLGRVWCTACPLELVNRVGDAIARRSGRMRLHLPGWMRSGWGIVGAYLLLQVLVAGASIHRIPHYASVMLVVLVSVAFLSGVLFVEPRSFCTTLCPAGALLSVYGRYTAVQLDTLDPQTCTRCSGRDCVRQGNRFRLDARSCPSLLKPHSRRQGDGCVLCLQCAKACPHKNVGWGVVSAAAPSRRHQLLAPFETAFVLIAAGFVTHELVGEVPWLEDVFHVVPSLLGRLLPGAGFGWLEAAWFLVLFPLGVWILALAASYAVDGQGTMRVRLAVIATGAAPIIAVAHLAKAAAKLSGWAGYLPLALRDPAGLRTLEAISSKASAAPQPFLHLSVLGWLMGFVVLAVGVKSWRWSRQAAPDLLASARLGFGAAALLFTSLLGAWAVS